MPPCIRVLLGPHIQPEAGRREEGRRGEREVRLTPPPGPEWGRGVPHQEAGIQEGHAPYTPNRRQPHLLRMMMSPTTKARPAKIRPPLRTAS